jgi:transcriptional regulator with XRE-family HTH domain
MPLKVSQKRAQALRQYLLAHLPQPGIASMSALARLAGLRPSTVTAWWSQGTAPDHRSLKRLAGALGLPVESLVAAYEGATPAGRVWVLTTPELEELLSRAAEEGARRALAERDRS